MVSCMQAYYNPAGTPPIPPPGYFHSSVASSPQAHPYMWGPQVFYNILFFIRFKEMSGLMHFRVL